MTNSYFNRSNNYDRSKVKSATHLNNARRIKSFLDRQSKLTENRDKIQAERMRLKPRDEKFLDLFP